MRRIAPAPIFVAAVWVAMTVSAVVYLARYAPSCPFQDDLETVASLVHRGQSTWEWLWALHNDHRLPVPLLIYAGLMRVTGDCRSGMYFQVAVLALVSLALILVARAVRGRTSFTDAFFPLLLQHLGNCGNLLLGFQLSVALQIALLCTILGIVAAGPPRPTLRGSLVMGACLLGLPWSMAHGLVQAPAIAAWMAVVGLGLAGSTGAESRAARRVLVAAAIAACALIGLYLRGFEFSPVFPGAHSPDVASVLRITFRMIALSIGPGAMDYWPKSAWVVGALVLATIALLGVTIRRQPQERYRASGILACLAASLSLAASIGWGRGGMFKGTDLPIHYVLLTSPLLATVYIAWTRYGPLPASQLVRISLFTILVAFADFNARLGRSWGVQRRADADRIDVDVRAGWSPTRIAERHWGALYPNVTACAERLEILHAAGMAPFRGRPYEANMDLLEIASPMFGTQLKSAKSTWRMLPRTIDGVRVLLVHAESELGFELRSGARRLSARYGVSPDAALTGQTDGVRFSAECVVEGHPPFVLFERFLDPRSRPEEGGIHDLAVEIPPVEGGRLFLRTSNPPGRDDEMDWAFWTAVRIE